MSEYIILSIFLFLGAFIAAAATVTGLLLGYRTKNTKNKMAPYECGMETIGNARIQFKVGYYLFALLFLVFDIEALFLFLQGDYGWRHDSHPFHCHYRLSHFHGNSRFGTCLRLEERNP